MNEYTAGVRCREWIRRCSHSPADTHRIAAAVVRAMHPHRSACILLEGGLGAGKTEFVRGVVRAVRLNPAQVHSPTFVFASEYRRRGAVVHHVDLYRCPHASRAADVVRDLLEEAAADALRGERSIVCVEWADRLPHAALRMLVHSVARCVRADIRMASTDEARVISVGTLV